MASRVEKETRVRNPVSWRILGSRGLSKSGLRLHRQPMGSAHGNDLTSVLHFKALKYASLNGIHSPQCISKAVQASTNNGPFPKINQKASLARLVKHRFTYTTNWLFANVNENTLLRCFPSAKWTMVGVNPGSAVLVTGQRKAFSEGWLRRVTGVKAQTPRSVSVSDVQPLLSSDKFTSFLMGFVKLQRVKSINDQISQTQ